MVKIIENYSLHQQIGEGEYGKVFRAIDARNKKEVAVKVINVKKFKQYPKLQECTLNQIQILSKIESPYIIKFIQILKTANNFYFFYQFCNEGTLDDKIKKYGRLSEAQAIQYLNQLLQAFKILSSKNIMHRDLKPCNILFSNGKIKLADFGFCKTLENQRDLAQTMLGSPIYMAPQVLKGQIYTVKADIWSLGVVIYEMLFGFCPFQQKSIARLINLLESQEVIFNKDINPISQKMQQLLRKILVKDHFKRIGWQEVFSFQFNQQVVSQSPKSQYNIKNHNYFNLDHRNPLCQKQEQNYIFNNTNSKTGPSMFKKKNSENCYIEDELQASKTSHKKLLNYIKIVYNMVSTNYCPQLTASLAVRLYSIIQKEHYKLPMRKQFSQERACLIQSIKIFQQGCKDKNEKYSGPLLTQYIKMLQNNYPSSFSQNDDRKQLLVHCLDLLDMNEIGNIKQLKDYSSMSKDKLLNEFNQKIIRNTI